MKKVYLFILVVVILIIGIILAGFILLSVSSSDKNLQNQAYDQIFESIENLDRSCNTDTDCVSTFFSCPFPCSLCANRNANPDKIEEDIENYKETYQDWCMHKCGVVYCKCINNICKPIPSYYKNPEFCDEYVGCDFYEMKSGVFCGNIYYVNSTKSVIVFDEICSCDVKENKCVILSANK